MVGHLGKKKERKPPLSGYYCILGQCQIKPLVLHNLPNGPLTQVSWSFCRSLLPVKEDQKVSDFMDQNQTKPQARAITKQENLRTNQKISST